MLNYTPEQLWKIYKKLPEELKDAIFSEKTANDIYQICKRNKIEEKESELAKLVGCVLGGVLPPEKFLSVLKENLKLTNSMAQKIDKEVNRFIFSPVQEALSSIYGGEIGPLKTTTTVAKRTTASKHPDPYREPIE